MILYDGLDQKLNSFRNGLFLQSWIEKMDFFWKTLSGNLHSIRNLFWKIEYIFLSDYETGLTSITVEKYI